MSGEDERDGSARESAGQGQTSLHGLSPHSYTANRLHHASERHLHLTTRRIFIGPIPDAWISKHRKAWYKHRPRMLTYSSRTASFNAAKDSAQLRQLTGLDSDDRVGIRQIGLSFPQPADLGEEALSGSEDNGQGSDSESGRHQLNGSAASAGQIDRNSSRRRAGEEPGAEPSESLHPVSPDTHNKVGQSSSSEAKSFVTAQRRKSHDRSSFVTAHETLRSTPNPGSSEDQNGENGSVAVGLPAINEGDDVRHSGSTTGNLGDVGGGLRKTGSDERSTTSLILHDGAVSEAETVVKSKEPVSNVQTAAEEDNQTVSQTNNASTPRDRDASVRNSSKHALLEVPAEAYHEDRSSQAASPSSLHQVEPVSTGLVRFHLPDELAHRGQQAKGRVSEAKSKASFQAPRKAKAEPGQLLKAERMLVRVDSSKHKLPDNYSENDSLKAETTTVEKWREFIVTCRRSAGEEAEFVIQMNKTRVIPMLDKEHRSKRSTHEIVLRRKVTKINMFSSLDKTIVVWAPWKKETRIYLVRPRSSASSVEWFTFLNFILGWRSPSKLLIHVPDLDVNLELRNPLRDADVLKEPADQSDTTDDTREQAAKVADGQVAKEIIDRSIAALQKSDFHDVLTSWSEEGEKVGLAWKRYDRLEWVHGANEERMYGSMAMQKTHDLELRPKRHYPTQVAKHPGTMIEEPSPVEGFLVRQTSQKGTHKRFGKTFFKRLYFSSHNNFLCFSEPGKALPPKPPELLHTDDAGLPRASEIAKKIPLIYSVDPFPLQGERITWLSETNVDRKKTLDNLAYGESERSLSLLLEAEGYINLCHVARVRRLKSQTPAPPEQGHDAEQGSESDESQDDKQEPDLHRTFEIVLRNGLVVRLQAFDKQTRKKWVQCLRAIVEYWKLRTAEDMDIYRQVRQSNLENLNIDEEIESFVGQEAQKWEVSRSVASPELFHMCGISCCRQMSGVLYRKPRVHSTFNKCVVILCHGKLLIFQSTLRARAGKEIPHILHEREEVVDLKDSYIYSGLLTEGDLLYHNQTFDSNHPGHHALPRVYRDDNWTSIDEDTTTCFVVWHGRRKSFFRANAQEGEGQFKSRLRYVSSLGVPGRSMVFKTRSRAERDHWVMSISMEIERLQQAEDIRVVLK